MRLILINCILLKVFLTLKLTFQSIILYISSFIYIYVQCISHYHGFSAGKTMGVPPIVNILDMVKVFSFAVDEGKVAVHCHAGLGEHYLESDAGHMMSCDLDYR